MSKGTRVRERHEEKNMSKKLETILLEKDKGVLTITLNRPELHNVFNEVMISELTEIFSTLSKDPKIRIVLLTGSGKSFCAGADLNWMKKNTSQY